MDCRCSEVLAGCLIPQAFPHHHHQGPASNQQGAISLPCPPQAASTSALHIAPSTPASLSSSSGPNLQPSHRWATLQDSGQCPVRGAPISAKVSWDSDPYRGAPNCWIQGPVARVSLLPPFPSQSRVTASTLRTPLHRIDGVWRFTPQREPSTRPIRDGCPRLVTQPGSAHTHTCPSPCPQPRPACPARTRLPSPAPLPILPRTCGARLRRAVEAGGDSVPRGQGPTGRGRGRDRGLGGNGQRRRDGGPDGGGAGGGGGGGGDSGSIPRRPVRRRGRGAVSARPGQQRRGRRDAGGAANWLSPIGPAPSDPASPAYI